MNIEKLQKALTIMNRDGKSGNVFAYHDELHLFPMSDRFTADEVKQLEDLGFLPLDEDSGFMCFT